MTQFDQYAAPVHQDVHAEFDPNDWKALKKLWNDTCSVRALGFLWSLLAVCFIPTGAFMLAEDPAGWVLLAIGTLSLLGAVGMIGRFRIGRIFGIVTCCVYAFGFPVGTVIGVVGLIALNRSPVLFGPDRVTHKQVIAKRKQMKLARKLAR